jgi:hypothetical protein
MFIDRTIRWVDKKKCSKDGKVTIYLLIYVFIVLLKFRNLAKTYSSLPFWGELFWTSIIYFSSHYINICNQLPVEKKQHLISKDISCARRNREIGLIEPPAGSGWPWGFKRCTKVLTWRNLKCYDCENCMKNAILLVS